MTSLIRSRWAAFGAAIAVTVGGGGLGLVGAAVSTGERAVFVAITPCRLVDTRAGAGVLPRNTPFGPGEIYTIKAHGNNGQCVGIPTDATALSLNITSLDATTLTYFTFWPTGTTQPNASSLNPAPGQPPTPNAVITDISPGGQFNIFNEKGTVGAIIDINGYYVDHNHDDRYYTEAEVDARLAAAKPITVYDGGNQRLPLTLTAALYRSVTIVPPVNGTVVVNAAGWATGLVGATFYAMCSISAVLTGDALSTLFVQENTSFAGTRGFTVSAGVPLAVYLTCARSTGSGGEAFIEDTWLTATFTPA